MNESATMLNATVNCTGKKAVTDLLLVKFAFLFLYLIIFLMSISGNLLVVYVVLRTKQMQTVTNVFIANLAISDLMVSCTSLWLTPVYTYVGHWIWGGWLCYGLPLFQGTFIFISTLTLMSIALDRYFVICRHDSGVVNVNEHMSMQACMAIITLIWTVSLLLVMPYAVHMRMAYVMEPCNFYLCIEDWAMEDLKSFYGIIVLSLQFVLPFALIGYSYTSIWHYLNQRKSLVSERESEYETQRKRRLLRMLVTMVVLFAICWLPFNLLNILRDFKVDSFLKPYFSFLFLLCHLIAMTATVYNPLLYAWMNLHFRNEFIRALPFLAQIFHACCFSNGGEYTGGALLATAKRQRARVLTDCTPAPNRKNCGDNVRCKKHALDTQSSRSTPSYRPGKGSMPAGDSGVDELKNLLGISHAHTDRRRSDSPRMAVRACCISFNYFKAMRRNGNNNSAGLGIIEYCPTNNGCQLREAVKPSLQNDTVSLPTNECHPQVQSGYNHYLTVQEGMSSL